MAEGHAERRETELYENRAVTTDQFPGAAQRQEESGDGQLFARGGFSVHLASSFFHSKLERLSDKIAERSHACAGFYTFLDLNCERCKICTVRNLSSTGCVNSTFIIVRGNHNFHTIIFRHFYDRNAAFWNCTTGRGRILKHQTLFCTTGRRMRTESRIWVMLLTRFLLIKNFKRYIL